jgi:SAGA-associated factor 29
LLFNAAPEVVEKPGDTSLAKLKTLYTQAKELSESEVRYMYINL